MKRLIALCFLPLIACGRPADRSSDAPTKPATADALFGYDTPGLVGAKCVALLGLPQNATAEKTALKRRWEKWLQNQMPPEQAAQMIQLNAAALVDTPADVLTAGDGYCREKLELWAPLPPETGQ